ncbi:hypothetical protein KSD_77760 [Ktedonobacter sp. SOSP1-85]|uniref:non-ribosomal peptide synthetase n=1 Tax=Ktedonobacter sp. SOSP1-85 TaxID=2778367 RepID=UPI0019151365|nr:non-ribosomal peptide synthetase [Ktedonobacter sp. SOSP1-85]GHO80005.1 hypothetical protein KSD_77760 [Ktedonobacter sp. SOSP1-85]
MSDFAVQQKQRQLRVNILRTLEESELALKQYHPQLRDGAALKSAVVDRDSEATADSSVLEAQLLERLNVLEQQFLPTELATQVGAMSLLKRSMLTIKYLQTLLEEYRHAPVPPQTTDAVDARLPLSFAQQRLWFLEQLHPGTSLYNEHIALRLQGPLHLDALELSCNEIVRRHEILRTTFVQTDGETYQHIAPWHAFKLATIDLADLPSEEREARLQSMAEAELEQPFDLRSGPLYRIRLFQLAEEEHLLLTIFHHTLSDGWSLGIFYHELSVLYGAYSVGEASPLAELPIQYADYARQQRQWLQGETLDRQLDYWRQQLQDAPTQLNFPTDRPRPATQGFVGSRRAHLLPGTLLQQLKKLSQSEGVTLFMTLLAAFEVLLNRYSGQDDILIGSPIANRTRGELEGLIGFFVNTLVLRADVSGNPDFREVLQRVRAMTLGAYEHQEMPFEKLVAELDPERDASGQPFFRVAFAYQNFPLSAFELPGISWELLTFPKATATLDLHMELREEQGGLLTTITYSTDAFEAATIERFLEHWQLLLEGVVHDVAQPISRLPLLLPSEAQRLRAWNETELVYTPEQCVHTLFTAQAERTPDAVAIAFEEQILTYEQLDQRANQLAHALLKLGVETERAVGVYLERSPLVLISILGIMKAGGVYIPLDPSTPTERLAWQLEDVQPQVVLTQARLLHTLPVHSTQIFCLDSEEARWREEAISAPASRVTPEQLAYVIYTSGSTGRPRGVMVQHWSICNTLNWRQATFQLTARDSVLQKIPTSFDASLGELLWPLLAGARLVLARPDGHKDSAYLCAVTAEQAITTQTFVASTLRVFLEEPGFAQCRDLRQILCGGEALSSALLEQVLAHPSLALYNVYGPTEAAVEVSCWPCERGTSDERISIGRPIANTRLYILDAEGQVAPIGVPGELCIGGVNLARGYLNRPELTAERFIPDPFSQVPGARLYRTGDMARYRDDGALIYMGRYDHQVKIRGFRIELGEIETVLRAHPLIREGVVVARERSNNDKQLVSYVVLDEETQLAEYTALLWEEDDVIIANLRAFLQRQLPEYMLPAHFVLMEYLPLTTSGKIDRRALPDPEEQLLSRDFVAPKTPLQQELAAIWSEILLLPQVGVTDNFFDLGGHSLLATQVVTRINQSLGMELPLKILFEALTIAELAQRIEALQENDLPTTTIPPLVALERPGQVPLSFAQQRLWFLNQLETNSSAYNVPGALRLSGPLSVKALEWSLQQIVQRHESLRTTFVSRQGTPIQLIAAESRLHVPVIDLCAVAEHEQALIQALAQHEAHHPFDLSQGPLLRTWLLRVGEEEHILLIDMHHIISDGWSGAVLLGELTRFYQAAVRGEAITLDPLPVQYADYTLWQRRWFQDEQLQEQLDYWKEQLVAAPPVLSLPTDRSRPQVQSYVGASCTMWFPLPLQQALESLSQRQGVTLFMTLLASFQVLLMRYSGQSDILVGTPVANRRHQELEGLIGFFVNTLVLRSDLSGNPSFLELLARVREVCLDAYAHQDLPFERLVEDLQPERDLSRQPLFQIMFILLNTPPQNVVLDQLSIKMVEFERKSSKFDLSLQIEATDQGLSLLVEYSTDLFDADTIERMMQHWRQILQAIVADPQQRIATVPLLIEAQREELLHHWNDTGTTYPRSASLHQLFEEQVERSPDAVAVVFEGAELSYAELNRRANQLAHRLQEMQVGPDTLVGVCLERSLELVIALLGVLKAGGAYVPLDPVYPQERLHYMLHDAQVSVVLTQEALRDRTSEGEGITQLVLDTDWGTLSHQPVENIERAVPPEQLAYMIYTSGSTGRPKGAMNTHQGIRNRLLWMQQAYELSANDRVLQKTPYSFDVSVWEFFWPLIAGARLVVAIPGGHQDPTYLKDMLNEQAITTLHFVPAMLQAFLLEPRPEQCRSLRQVICSGEALSVDLQKTFFTHMPQGTRLHNLYGPTEAAVDVSFWECQEDSKRSTVPIGYPIANMQLYVLDTYLQPVPVGVVGELYIAGVGLARGYHQRADLTAEKFLPHPFSNTEGARIYQTGDLARYQADGAIEYMGRIDGQVKIRGFRIELGEIESVLQAHPAVQESVVIVQERAEDKQLVAYLVPAADTQQINDGGPSWEEEHVGQWQMLYNDLYTSPSELEDPTLNIVGWNSSYTGEPIAPEEMRVQVEQAVSRILAHAPKRVMEIGCGTGLLLFRIAPHTTLYRASDFSKEALSYVEQVLATQPLPQVHLEQQLAHEATQASAETFDAVILNSLVQYFPSANYLRQVLLESFALLEPDGFLFIGDVRNLALHRAYATSVELYKAAASLSKEELRQRVRQRMQEEEELLIDPAFFLQLQRVLPQAGEVQLLLKRGRTSNELTRFRYDVLVSKGHSEGVPVALAWQWRQEVESLAQLQTYLQEQTPDELLVRGLPNSRLEQDLRSVQWAFGEQGPATVGAFREELQQTSEWGLDPEDLWHMGEQLGYQVSIYWSETEDGGVYDVSFQKSKPALKSSSEQARAEAPEVLSNSTWSRYTNNPLQGKITRWVLPQLREFLKERLPEYMLPAHFVALEQLPLTANGKVDRKALPLPEEYQLSWQRGRYVAPATPLQQELASIWSELLLRPHLGIADNFFELGGHSLLAMQVIARVQQALGVELALRTLFEAPTIAELAQRIEALKQIGSSEGLPPLVPMARPEQLPLSFAQQRLWFLDQLEPGSATYNMPAALRLVGPLSFESLEESFHGIVQRHESLRTTFVTQQNQPLQHIAAMAELQIQLIELSGVTLGQREEYLKELAREEAHRPFDLARGPLLRVRLLRLQPQEHILLFNMHHIISDGWSIGVLVRELTAFYRAAVRGKSLDLAPLPIQYADYTLWQRQWLQDEQLQQQLEYWQAHLADAPPLLDLPTDRPRPQVQSYAGAELSLLLPLRLRQGLEALSQQQGATLFMTLLASFQLLLMRYSGQSDLVIGTPVANRRHRELEGLIGLFVNTLALRGDLSGDPTFLELLARTREVCLGAYAHQDVPLEQVVTSLPVERSLSYAPLFQVLFALQNVPQQNMVLEQLSLETVAFEHKTSKFDLSVLVQESEQGLQTSVEYNTDLFDATTIQRLMQHWQQLLQTLVTEPRQRLSAFALLSPTEREQLLVQWNQTRREWETPQHIHALLARQAERFPDRLAVSGPDGQLTYAALQQQVQRLARRLQALGVGPETLVGLYLERSAAFLISVLATWRCAGASVPLDPAYPQQRVQAMLQQSALPLLLTRSQLRDSVPSEGTRVLCLDELAETSEHETWVEPPLLDEQLAYVIYTSGSTGQPKGVMVTQQGMRNHLWAKVEALSLGEEDVVAQTASQCFDISVWQLFAGLLHGGRVAILPDAVAHDPWQLLRAVEEGGISILQVVPSLLGALLDQGGGQVLSQSRVRWVSVTGEAMPVELCRHWWREEQVLPALLNAYGPTECSDDVTHAVLQQPEEQTGTWRVPIGRPLANTQLYVLDEQMQPVPAGVIGELYVGGMGVGRGYLNEPEKTAGVFVPDPYGGKAGARVYRTGDRVRYRGDGQLEFVERQDEQVKLRGYRIELGEIEAALNKQRQIKQSVVVLRAETGEEKRLVAYVVPEAGEVVQPGSEGELRSALKERLPEYMLPAQFVLLDALPLSPNGKVDRRQLPVPEASLSTTFVAPRNPREEQLAHFWRQLFHAEQIGVHDNFFDLGGHSLLATQVIAWIRETFQVELPLRSLFETPTIADLTIAIEQKQVEQTDSETLASVLAELNLLSEDEVQAQLAREK